jgi:restriction system protein
MAFPDFQTLMLPALKLFSDGQIHTNEQVVGDLAKQYSLTDEHLAEMLPSRRAPLFYNRVAWALTYLTGAQLLESVGRGQRRITDRGKKILKAPPPRIDLKFLGQFPELARLRKRKDSASASDPVEASATSGTPDEVLSAAFETAQEPKRAEILNAILAKPPEFFEQLVLDVMTGAGYGGRLENGAEHLGKSGDGGVDGVIKEDALGLELIYVQAKCYKLDKPIGRPDVQQFAGSLEGFRAKKGIFITTSTFADTAIKYAQQIEKKIALIDGEMLVDLMLKYDVGVKTIRKYELKDLDQDYFNVE